MRDGIEMAIEAKLPQEIIQAIEEHHGTTLVKYFIIKRLAKIRMNLLKKKITGIADESLNRKKLQ